MALFPTPRTDAGGSAREADAPSESELRRESARRGRTQRFRSALDNFETSSQLLLALAEGRDHGSPMVPELDLADLQEISDAIGRASSVLSLALTNLRAD
jgi:hypothetical protein